MRLFLFFLLILSIGIKGEAIFKFKEKTLKYFNGARRMIASGYLKPFVQMVNHIFTNTNSTHPFLADVGPAANMHKLRWSPKLEQAAFEYIERTSSIPTLTISTFNYKGYVGFQWPGVFFEIADTLVKFIPNHCIKIVMKLFLHILEELIAAILLIVNYPSTIPIYETEDIGVDEMLFAHRYEIGCYAKVGFAACCMESSRNRGFLFEPGVPCSKCLTHCEFFEYEDGRVEEGDLCVPPQKNYKLLTDKVHTNSEKKSASSNSSATFIFPSICYYPALIMIILFK